MTDGSDISLEQLPISDTAPLQRTSPSRRLFMASAGALTASTIFGAQAQAQQKLQQVAYNFTPTWRLRPAPTRNRPSFVKNLSRLVDLNEFNQGGQYWNFSTYITATEEFFIRNEYATPRLESDKRVDPRFWRLKIHGDGVERPLEISYDDLLGMPSKTITCTMECAGNGRSLFWEQQNMVAGATKVTGTGWGLGGIGQAEWQYVPMSYILGLVGLKKTAKAALFWSGVDGKSPGIESDSGRPVPISMFLNRGDDVGLAYRMNGQDLLPDHGAPVRALVPGWCGAASIKWLTELKIASHDFWVPLNSMRHVMIGPDYAPPKPKPGDELRFVKPENILGPMVTWSPPRSLITVPLVLEKQPKIPHNYPLQPGQLPTIKASAQMMRGYAWAPQWGVKRVQVRANGRSWQDAQIIDPTGQRYKWVRFQFPFNPAQGRHFIETRVTDMKGTVQPETVAFNQGGFNNWSIPKFHVEAV
jgi:sulfane dehydrogenase subunit SoxC